MAVQARTRRTPNVGGGRRARNSRPSPLRRLLVLGAIGAAIALSIAASNRVVVATHAIRAALPPTAGGNLGVTGGALPEGTTPFDTNLPGIAKMDTSLLRAVQQAARDAQADGVRFVVTSGWRSAAYQQQLFSEAVATYGSEREAQRYVATAEDSRHVTGEAVDIGPTNADSWLSQHGTKYGLCQTYANEMWHFELATKPGGRCPPMQSDATP
jgi:D-alanyl-D-alanine carboxypeptidase